MREYETTIIVHPEISDEGSVVIFDRLNEILERFDSERLLCENLGKRKLAYEIRKFHKGHYYILSYLSDGKVVPDLERALRLDESILRFMTIVENTNVTDIEGRKALAKEQEAEQERKAAERAAREAEEAAARAEVERKAAEEAAEAAAAAAAAAALAAAAAAEQAEQEADPAEAQDSDSDSDSDESGAKAEAAAESSDAEPSGDESTETVEASQASEGADEEEKS